VSTKPEAIHSEADTKSAIAKVLKAIRYHDQKYCSENAPVISDAEIRSFSRGVARTRRTFSEIAQPGFATEQVSGKPRGGFAQVKHPPRMLSLKPASDEKAVLDFDRSCRAAANKPVEYLAESKYDGVPLLDRFCHVNLELR
jgi:DNA ligase (NAD+)